MTTLSTKLFLTIVILVGVTLLEHKHKLSVFGSIIESSVKVTFPSALSVEYLEHLIFEENSFLIQHSPGT